MKGTFFGSYAKNREMWIRLCYNSANKLDTLVMGQRNSNSL